MNVVNQEYDVAVLVRFTELAVSVASNSMLPHMPHNANVQTPQTVVEPITH